MKKNQRYHCTSCQRIVRPYDWNPNQGKCEACLAAAPEPGSVGSRDASNEVQA